MGAFSGMKGTSRGFTSNSMREGRYLCRIDECAFFSTDKGDMWKNTLTILAVEDGDHKVGEVVHTFFSASKGRDIFLRNIKTFIANVLDCTDEEVDEANTLLACSENSKMIGLVTLVTAIKRNSQTKKDENGVPYTYVVHGWTPSLSDDEIVAALSTEARERFFPNLAA